MGLRVGKWPFKLLCSEAGLRIKAHELKFTATIRSITGSDELRVVQLGDSPRR